MQRPCIFVPGILGVSLENTYPIRPETTWSMWEAAEEELFGIELPRLMLTDDGETDLDDEVVTRAGALLPSAYGGVVRALRGRLRVPVYLFPYDWRFSAEVNGVRLMRLVRRLRKKPMRSVEGWDGSFDFACHSLGGLVFRAFVAAWVKREATAPPVGRVAHVAVAHRGSIDAVEAMVRGQTMFLGGRKELRKLARTFPSVYELMPTFPALVGPEGRPLDVFDIASWQRSVTVAGSSPDPDGHVVSAAHLARARAFLAELPQPGVAPEQVLCVYGNRPGSTMRQLPVLADSWFDFAHPEWGDGDEVVLADSARIPGVAAVEIAHDDVSYFALKARHVSMHAFLMTLDEVQTVVGRFLQGLDGQALLPRGMPATRFQDA